MVMPTRVTRKLIQMALNPLSNAVPQAKRPAALESMDTLQQGGGVEVKVGRWEGGQSGRRRLRRGPCMLDSEVVSGVCRSVRAPAGVLQRM